MRLSRPIRTAVAAVTLGALALGLAGCGDSGNNANGAESSQADEITVYSGQHEEFIKAVGDAFEKKTGIKVTVRAGEDNELTSQILAEGENSPADVLLTEEPGPMAALAKRGVFAPVDQSTRDKVPAQYQASDGSWIGVAARARAIIFNPSKISESDLPKSILDLTDSKWKDKFAYAPSGAFIGTVSYLRSTIGDAKTEQWLKGIKATGKNLKSNGAIRDAVEAGQVPFGLINHYYWFLKADQVGAKNMHSKLYYIGHQDAGALVFASGAAVLNSSDHQEAAQKFLAFLVAPDGGQKMIAEDTPQYPVAKNAPENPKLKPLDELGAPTYEQSQLADEQGSIKMLTELGML